MSSQLKELAVPGDPASKGQKTNRKDNAWLVLPILPCVILVAALFLYPVVQAFRISLSNWDGAGPIVASGLSNYVQALTSSDFLSSLLTTFLYAISCAVGVVAIACVLGAAISQNVRGSRFYRVIWFIPGVAPAAAVAVFWSTAFQPHYGFVNVLLGYLGLGTSAAPLASTTTALLPVIFVSIWAASGFAFVLVLGGMEQIPVAVYEAARLDGASGIRQFFSITLPLARPVIAITLTLNFIWAFNNFTTIQGLTAGGPAEATTTLPLLVFKDAFLNGQYGQATAVAVLAGVFLMAIGAFSLRLGSSRESK